MDSKGYPSMWRRTAPLLRLRFAGVFAQSSEVDTSTQSSYPLCTGALDFISDGECDDSNNNAECGWDEGDCCYCTCEDSSGYACGPYFDCQDPGAWCHTETADPTSSSTSSPSSNPTSSPSSSPTSTCTGVVDDIADGLCNANNNNAACSYDGGDCCVCTCVYGVFHLCPFFDCQDPNAGCVPTTAFPTASPTPSPTGTCAGISDFIADGDCDVLHNIAACDYDGGDCCECTCEDGPLYTCGPSFDNCDDPLSNCPSPIVTPSPFGGRSPIDSDDGSTSGSTFRGISTAVLDATCVAGVLFIGVVAFCARRRYLERKRGGTRGGDRTPAANRPPPTAPSQTCGQDTSACVEHDGQLNGILDPFPVSEDQVGNTNPAAIMWLPFRETGEEEGVEATNPEGSPTNFPVAVAEPPSYTQAMDSVG